MVELPDVHFEPDPGERGGHVALHRRLVSEGARPRHEAAQELGLPLPDFIDLREHPTAGPVAALMAAR